ncbi:MAG: competence/damage-inducible protein A [Parasporobacterium sp.]|nr:competence/damage-inducible protein A [Parasporobacterium sp.]
MTAEIICVGTELLLGNILNTDARFMAEKLAEYGLSVYYQTVVGDNAERLKSVFLQAFERSDIILTSGGLGPTEDDLTKEVISEALGLNLVEHEESRNRIYERFSRMGKDHCHISLNNLKQAMIPEGAKALNNDYGTAPAVLIEQNNKTVFLLPGPPGELFPLFNEYVVPYLQEKSNAVLKSLMVKTAGIGESDAASILGDLLSDSQNPTVAPYASAFECKLRITARADSESEADEMIKPVYEKIYEKIGQYIYAAGDQYELEDAIINYLRKENITIACAESLTGGMLSARLINVPGASDCFKQGFITYNDEAKNNTLGVSKDIIDTYSAVSAQCAAKMAEGAALKAGADIGLSTTGFAGPGENAGLAYIGFYYKGRTVTKEVHIPGDRNRVRAGVSQRALLLTRMELQIPVLGI